MRKYRIFAVLIGSEILFHTKNAFYYECIQCDSNALREILDRKKEAYTEFQIPKKGGFRKLYSIDHEHGLYAFQKRLADKFFASVHLPLAVKGFVKGSSYADFLLPHCGNKHFMRVDIKDFFGSITSNAVTDTLRSLISVKEPSEKAHIVRTITAICCLGGVLPQGAVTSPSLSNLVFARSDQRITKYCQRLGITYTRYADDLLFSADEFDFSKKPWFLKKIKYILADRGFALNYSKTKISNGEISLNGFVVGESVRLSRRRLSDIVAVIRCLESAFKSGVSDAAVIIGLVNGLSLNFRSDNPYGYFAAVNDLCNYLCGYRSFLITWLRAANERSAQRIKEIINRIETCVKKLDAI